MARTTTREHDRVALALRAVVEAHLIGRRV
jgi:hypothetical protein